MIYHGDSGCGRGPVAVSEENDKKRNHNTPIEKRHLEHQPRIVTLSLVGGNVRNDGIRGVHVSAMVSWGRSGSEMSSLWSKKAEKPVATSGQQGKNKNTQQHRI